MNAGWCELVEEVVAQECEENFIRYSNILFTDLDECSEA